MRSVRLSPGGKVEMLEAPVPTPGEGEVLVRVAAAGLCGTDLLVAGGHYKDVVPPITLGHEASGYVESAGSSVSTVDPGDRIVPEGSWPCGVCDQCRDGGPCKSRRAMGRSVDGVFAEYAVIDERACHPLPPGVSDLDAQAVVTVATVLRALSRAPLSPGSRAAIIGAGHTGYLFLQGLRDAGLDELICLGTRPERLEPALEHGATQVINVRSPDHDDERRRWARAGGLADVVFETSGTSQGLDEALELVRPGGVVVAFSIYTSGGELSALPHLYERELSIVGSRGGSGQYPAAIAAIEQGRFSPASLVTHQVSLEEAPDLVEAVGDRRLDVVRAVLQP